MAQGPHAIKRRAQAAQPQAPAAPASARDAMLQAVLSITSDAVVAFDEAGTIVLANDEALRVLAPSGAALAPEGLVGMNVRLLFPPVANIAPDAPLEETLPFASDGTTTRLLRTSADGQPQTVVVRCQRLDAAPTSYVLVAHPDMGVADSREHERLVEELSRANRRLSGTLDIVLDTLDSPSVSTLFERVLEELRHTMDAMGTAVYLRESEGFRLQATSASLEGLKTPRYLPSSRSLTKRVMASEHALRLRVLPPDGESLRKGRLSHRMVLDEQAQQSFRARASQLPPFASFLAVPVRFGGQVIALIEVGWRAARSIPRDDADLLDAVTRYLAVQLVGAFSALRTQRREQLTMAANDLHDALVVAPYGHEAVEIVLQSVSRDLSCVCVPLSGAAAIDGHETVQLPLSGSETVVPAVLLGEQESDIVVITPETPLGNWLREQGEPCVGALVDSGSVDEGERVRFLALRAADAEPFDDLEQHYLQETIDTVRAIASGERGRQQDHRISQALQTGMRSQLQEVPGITAQGIYSSATEAAFVGGDFYDLIRLPERKACVIMGDVSGKGVEAASVSAAVRTSLGAYSWEGLTPARMVELLNDFLLGFTRLETFATLFVGIVDLAAGTLRYCSAGHPPALLVRARTGEMVWLDVQSGVVGAFHEMAYRNGRMRLEPGDELVLYTDGTTEARAEDGSFFGEEGLRDAVMREHARGFEGLLDRLLASVDNFTNNSLSDDVAMVALRFDEVGE